MTMYPGAYCAEGNLVDDNTILTPGRAAQYLAQQWNRPFTTRDLSNFYWNNRERLDMLHISPEAKDHSTTLWSLRTLKAIVENFPPPKLREEIHGKPGRPRKNKS